MSNFKAQYKPSANAQWQTKLSGTEHSCFREKERLDKQYPFTRVVDPDNRVVS